MSSDRNSTRKNRFIRLGSFLLAIVLLYLIYRDVDMDQLSQMLTEDVSYGWILLSLLFGLLGNVARGLRWALILDPLSPNKVSRWYTIHVMNGTYAVNLLLPRGGELWRCYAVSRHENIPIASVIGTVATDRITDILLIPIFLIILFTSPAEPWRVLVPLLEQTEQQVNNAQHSPWLLIGLVVLVLLMLIGLWWLRKSKVLKEKSVQIWQQIVAGFSSLNQRRILGPFLIWTVLMWVAYFYFFHLCFYAFPSTAEVTHSQSLIIFIIATIAVVIPVQGGFGPWDFVVITLLVHYGIGKAHAEGWALLVHGIQTAWVAICGVFAIFVMTLVKRRLGNGRNNRSGQPIANPTVDSNSRHN